MAKKIARPKPKGFLIGCQCPLADAEAKLEEFNRSETRPRVWKQDHTTRRARDMAAEGHAYLYAVAKTDGDKAAKAAKAADKAAKAAADKAAADKAAADKAAADKAAADKAAADKAASTKAKPKKTTK